MNAKNTRKGISYFLLLLVVNGLFMASCKSVKEYQKNKLNDSEMSLSSRKVEKTELNFQSYREGASGANGGKTGGGCGCN
jgi:fructose-specific phosphotransferase system IIC component